MRDRTRFFVLVLAGSSLSLGACSSTTTMHDRAAPDHYAVVEGEHVPVPDIRMGDSGAIADIIDQGKNHSRVMATLTELCETFGPRLTGSSSLEKSQRWARDRFESFGLDDAHLYKWGEIETRFDRGPSTGRVLLASGPDAQGEPKEVRTLEFTTLAWSRGTDGPLTGPVVHLPSTMDELEQNNDRYAGAWVLIPPSYAGKGGIRSTGYMMRDRMDQRDKLRKEIETGESAPAKDLAATEPADGSTPSNTWEGTFDYHGSPVPATFVLDESGDAPSGTMSIKGFSQGPVSDIQRDGDTVTFTWKHEMGVSNIELEFDGDRAKGVSRSASGNEFPLEFTRATALARSPEAIEDETENQILAAVLKENPNGFISSSKDERVWTTSSNNWRERKLSEYGRDVEVNVRQSDYDFLSARAGEGVGIRVEIDAKNRLIEGPFPVYDVIAEIRGTEKPDEVVIISAHMDSWDGPGSQGATDNGTGTCVTIEAARILAAAGVKPKRTIRFALWSGEEQGLLGSKGYVQSLSDDQLSRISAAFVDDGGTNTEGGIPAADYMVDYLAAATAPTNGSFYSPTDGKYLDVNIRPTGAEIKTHSGSDHASFNKAGVPGFFWDETGRADYPLGWHTQNDRLNLAIEEYLIQSATNAAIVAYNLANAPDLLPRTGEVFDRPDEHAAEPEEGHAH